MEGMEKGIVEMKADDAQLEAPEVIGGAYLTWYQRRILDVWMRTGSLVECEKAIKRNWESRAIEKWLKVDWVQGYIKEEMRRRGFDKHEIERRLIRDVVKEERMDDGQRDSLKILSKIRGYWNENPANVYLNQTFDVRQGNGER